MPRDPLDLVYFGNTLRAWLVAAAIFAAVVGALLLVRRAVARRLEARAPRTPGRADDLALALVRGTSVLFLAAAAVPAARTALPNTPQDVRDAVTLAARLALYLQAARWGNTSVDFWLLRAVRERSAHDKSSVATLNLIGLAARVAIWVLLGLLVLDAFGVDITALVTGLGIAGVAVALAVQNVLGDLLASLSIALDKPFVVGDTITVDQFQGTVEDIGLKTTRIRSLTGELIVMSNAELLKARIRNYQGQRERRVTFTLTFPVTTPAAVMARVPPAVREVVEAQPDARFDRSHFSAITDQALAVETVYVMTTADYNVYMDTQQRINLALLDRLAAEGAELAVPTRAVTVVGEPRGEPPRGDAAPAPFAAGASR